MLGVVKIMALIKYEFCIATNRIGSENKEIIEIDLEDDLTEEEIDNQVNEIYTEWLFEKNNGWCTRVSD